jgi:RHS repeat-associated protein
VVISRTTSGAVNVDSLLLDHQGSIATIVADATGATVANESFTPYGNRREASTWSGSPTSAELNAMNGVTREGYNFQTVLGSMGLNHMSGRVEDAGIGRFLSPDPYTSQPKSTQGWNRYSYVTNNPLTFTDPTGFDCAVVDDQGNQKVIPCPDGDSNVPGQRTVYNQDGSLNSYQGTATRDPPPAPPPAVGPPNQGSNSQNGTPGSSEGGGSRQGGHDYRTRKAVCRRPLTEEEQQQLLNRFTVPNVYTQGQPQGPGVHMVASPWTLGLPGGWVTTSFTDNGLGGINTTTPFHVFTGVVTRQISNSGGVAYMETRGTGGYNSQLPPPSPDSSSLTTAFVDIGELLDMINQMFGPLVFDAVDQQAARYAAAHFPGC